MPAGFLDVTAAPYFADPTGATDSTAALQAAINAGRDEGRVVWFPAGTYRVSARLEIDQPDNQGYTPVVLMGSTVNPAARATLFLAPNSPGFDNPAARRAMIHFFNIGTADAESGNTDLYDHAVIGLDLKIGAGNPGAVALRMQSAEGSTIQDVNIDLTEGGHTGVWGIPGSGGSTHRITVTGGVIGIDTIKPSGEFGGSQPTPVITGSTFINQSSWAIRSAPRGPLVLVGCRFERDTPGAFFQLHRHWAGQPFDGSLQLMDSSLAYAAPHPDNTVIAMGTSPGRSFLFDNVHLRHAPHVWTPSASATANGWHHFTRLAVEVRPQSRSWGQGLEVVWQNGVAGPSLLVEGASGVAPPADLQTRHQWAADFPTWEHPGVIDVTTLGAVGDGVTDNRAVLQAAIDAHEKLFFPKGVFAVSGPLDLRPDTKLLGAYPVFSTLTALSTPANRFGGVAPEAPDAPIVRSADTAAAQTWLAFIQIQRLFPVAMHSPVTPGNHALEWRSGGDSLLRHVMLESRPTTNVRPDFIAKTHYGYNTDNPGSPNYRPVNPNHPQQSFLPGDHAWPNATPNVIVRGHGGGRWFGFWFHGRQALRQETPFLRVENTTQPLHFYHLHLQQQDSRHHAEFYRAANVSIYGVKGEVKGAILHFEQSDNIRVFGLSGRLSPDSAYFDQHAVRFLHSTNFSLSGLNDTIQESSSEWFGGEFDRWLHANILSWRPLDDVHGLRSSVSVSSLHRPLLYLRGAPSAAPVPSLPLVARITGPADGAHFAQGQTVTLSGTVTDRLDGNVSATGRWFTDRDGLLGQGATLALATLSPGTHTLVFEAANARGDYSLESRTVIVHPYGATLTYTVAPEADATVRAGADTNLNYGADTTLRARAVENSEALLRFPLPTGLLGEIASANLVLHLNANDTGTLVVHALPDLGWNEMTVTGATRPARGAALGELAFDGNQTTPQTLDVSAHVLAAVADHAPAVAFAATSVNFLRLRSRESSDPARLPRLVLATTIPTPPDHEPPPPPSAIFAQNFSSSSLVADYTGSADHLFDFIGTDTNATNNRATLAVTGGRLRNTVAYTDDANTSQISATRLTRRTNLLIEENFAVVSATARLSPQNWPAGDTTYLGFVIGQNFRAGIFNPASGTGNGPQFASLNLQARSTAHTFRTTGAGGNSANFTVTPTAGVYEITLVVAANAGASDRTFPSPTGLHTVQPGRLSVWLNGVLHLNNTATGVTAANLLNFSFSTGSGTAQGFATGSAFTGYYELDDILVRTVSHFAAPPPPDPYAAWRAAYSLSGDNALDTVDPDGDDAPNLLEYALGGDPLTPDNATSAPAPSLNPSPPHFLRLTFLRARADVTYEVLASSTLAPGSWTVVATNPGIVGELVTVTDPQPIAEHPRRFLRLRVTASSP